MSFTYPQPASWFLQLAIGSSKLTTIPPEYVVSFTHVRTMMDSVGTFELTLFYEGNSELENLIAEQGFGAHTKRGNVFFRYGVANQSSTDVYESIMAHYELTFDGGGTQLILGGTTLAIVNNSRAYVKTYRNSRIDEIVKQIAHDQGWRIGTIEPCVPLMTSVDDITGEVSHKTFHQMNIQPLQFIKEELIPYAVSSLTGLGGYTVSISNQSGSAPTLSFCPPQITKPTIAQFMYYAGQSSDMITWNPQIPDAVNISQGGGQLGVASMNSLTNGLSSFFQTDASSPSMPIMGSRVFADRNVAVTYMNTSSMMEKEMEARAKSLWMKNANLSYTATMEIPLSMLVNPNDTVDILIMDSGGRAHYTSGVYLVRQITDTMDASGGISSVSLIKNALMKGSQPKHGKEVTGPKKAPSKAVVKP